MRKWRLLGFIATSRPEQILDNIGMIKNTDFAAEELSKIDEISKNINACGK